MEESFIVISLVVSEKKRGAKNALPCQNIEKNTPCEIGLKADLCSLFKFDVTYQAHIPSSYTKLILTSVYSVVYILQNMDWNSWRFSKTWTGIAGDGPTLIRKRRSY